MPYARAFSAWQRFPRFRPGRVVAAALLVIAAVPAAAGAQSPTAPLGAPTIEAAVRSGDANALNLAVVAAIAANPARVEAIIRRAIAAAPGRRDAIVGLAVETFPGFAERIQSTAGGTAAPPPPGPEAAAAPAPSPAARAKAPPPEPVSRWSGEVSLGGAVTTGNTETERVNAAVAATNERNRWTHRFGLAYDFATDAGTITADRLVADAETNYDLSPRIYSLAFGEYEDDRFGGFDYVLTVATGLGYRLVLGPPLSLMADAGPGLRHSRRRDGGADTEPVGRARVRLKWRISETAAFTNDTVFVQGSERRTTENKAALTVDVVGNLKGRLALDVRHNSSPPAGTESTDTETKASLVYTF